MKTKFYLLALMTMMFFAGSKVQAQTAQKSPRILVAYFSHSGNTRDIAHQIKEATGADIFEIVPAKAYPGEYQAVVNQAKKEINAGYKPALKTDLKDMGQYDIIFVGSPNWWSTMAPPVATFLSAHNFSGKTLVPFMTHAGGRMGHSVADIKKLCPQATLLTELSVRDTSVKNAHDEILKWLHEIKVIK